MEQDFAGRRGLEALGLSLRFTADDPTQFRASLAATSVATIDVYRIEATAFRCERTRELTESRPDDAVHFIRVEHGSPTVTVSGRSRMLHTGEITVLCDFEPYVVASDTSATVMSVRVPLDELLVPKSRIERAMAAPIDAGALAAAFGSYARALSRAVPEEGTAESRLLSRSIIELCRAILASTPAEPEDAAAARLAVRRFVEENLGDPGLDSLRVARGVGISRRRLHRLFEGEAASVAGMIRARRLERLHELYVAGGMTFVGASAAAGFGSVAAAYRAFRAQHGVAPTDYLEAQRGTARDRGAGRMTRVAP